MLTYLALRALSLIVPVLPTRFGYALAVALGDVAFRVDRRSRRNIASNLQRVLGPRAPDSERRDVARNMFRTAALNYYDLFRLPRLDLRKLEPCIKVRGWEHIEEALGAGRGVVIVAPHLGNLDVVAHLAVIRSLRFTVPTEYVRPRCLLDLVTRTRASRGLSIIPLDGTATPARLLYGALRRNEIVGIIGDRDVQGNGLLVPFFGAVARFPSGPVALALRARAPLLPVRALRGPNGTYDIEISPPLELPNTGDAKRDVLVGTGMVAVAMERFIRAAPGEWLVFEPIWPLDLQPDSRAADGLEARPMP